MDKQIQAKPSIYRDITFRSRLEARWAVYLDLRGIEWEYEPFTYIYTNEAFPSARERYTPDFYWVHNKQVTVLEVKPKYPNRDTIKHLQAIAVLLKEEETKPISFLLGYGSIYQSLVPQMLKLGKRLQFVPITTHQKRLFHEAARYRFDL